MANKYANLVGTNKIKDEYTKINTGFDGVETDIDALNDRVDALDSRVDTIITTPIDGEAAAQEIVDARASAVKSKTFATLDARFEETEQDVESLMADGTQHSKTARFVIGTSTAGWTEKDCDYLCDGTADQVEIMAALNALPATGGEIVILDGTYNITGGITINKDNVSIKGSVGTILKRTANNNRIITLLEVKNCKVEGLIIDGNLLSNLWNEGIRIENSHSNTITGVVVKDNKNGAGIRLMNSTNNIIFGNNCSNIGLSGSSVTGGIQLSDSDNNAIIGNICSNNQRAGVYMVNSNNNTITGNICHNNEREGGIYLSSSNNNTVTGNSCKNNSTGIYLSSSSNNTVTDNTCIRGTGQTSDYASDQYTIRLQGTANNYNLISSNNCMGKAVVVEGGTGNSAWGNKFDNTDDLP